MNNQSIELLNDAALDQVSGGGKIREAIACALEETGMGYYLKGNSLMGSFFSNLGDTVRYL